MPNSAVKPLILVVEDDPAVRNLIVAALEAHGLRHMAVETAHAAIAAASSQAPSIVLLDLGLPDMDGVKVVESVRTWSGMPIIVVSARSEDADKIRALDAGADDYLTKPFSVEELLARIRAITRAATAIDATTLSVGNVRLDTAACTLVGPEGEEHLANREFQLMELFMRNAGTRMPTERLMLEVWGEDAPEGANVVWVYISYLRKKLTALGANVAIRASRNQGYSLEVVEGDERA